MTSRQRWCQRWWQIADLEGMGWYWYMTQEGSGEDTMKLTPQLCRECSALRAEVERLRQALTASADEGCLYTGGDVRAMSCYRRGDDAPCPACRARAALEDREEVTP